MVVGTASVSVKPRKEQRTAAAARRARGEETSLDSLSEIIGKQFGSGVTPAYDESNVQIFDPVSDAGKTTFDEQSAIRVVTELFARVKALPERGVLFMRGDHVLDITLSFARIVVRHLASTTVENERGESVRIHPTLGRHLILVNPTMNCAETLDIALRDRGDALIVVADKNRAKLLEGWEIIAFQKSREPMAYGYLGASRGHLQKVLEYLKNAGPCTSAQVSAGLNIETSDASSRLKQLYNWGMIDRIPSGSVSGRPSFLNVFFDPLAPLKCCYEKLT